MSIGQARPIDPAFDGFTESLTGPRLLERLREGLIGENAMIEGPYGRRKLVYADYVASGRALVQVERFVLEEVLPWYANSHTEASHCGMRMTRMRRAARAAIAQAVGADDECAVIFAGSGATAGINRLVRLLDIGGAAARGEKPLVLIGPYEHHSNILPWRESGAEVVEIGEAPLGGPDLVALEAALVAGAGRPRLCTFSAASNVTGLLSDVDRVTALARAHGALAVWDYAGAAPYLPIAMSPSPETRKDAVVFSPHKFPGGPGASGVLVVRQSAIAATRPSWPGGGTVSFVSPWGHDYLGDLAAREEAGTPNVVGDLRAALVMLVKQAVGQEFIDRRNAELEARARRAWERNTRIVLLGTSGAARLPIFSFRVRDGSGGFVHHQLFTRLLSDRYGIQARGGCACAGPYAHRLLGIEREASDLLRERIRNGSEIDKPGWVRLNFSYLMDDAKADMIIGAVDELARIAPELAGDYARDEANARFRPQATTSAEVLSEAVSA